MKEVYNIKKGETYYSGDIPIPKEWYFELFENSNDQFEGFERNAGDIAKVDATITVTVKIKSS